MTTTSIDGLAQFKEQARATWAAGDYDTVSEPLWTAGTSIVRHTAVAPGDEVLDVACGTGNAAVQAAVAGGRVVGVDLTPELFGAARARAAAAGVEIELREGDAEALPFDDASFDVVLSTFGVMFAPRHEVAASELARVLRPGGRLGLCHWTPEGRIGAFFATIGAHLPPLPDFAASPLLWGDEEHLRTLFAGTGIDLRFDREFIDFRFDTVDEAVTFYETKFGPLLKARALLEPEGRWQALHDDFVAFNEQDQAADGTIDAPGEYLVAVGVKPA
jgi:SAM-dependent methyltransferase